MRHDVNVTKAALPYKPFGEPNSYQIFDFFQNVPRRLQEPEQRLRILL